MTSEFSVSIQVDLDKNDVVTCLAVINISSDHVESKTQSDSYVMLLDILQYHVEVLSPTQLFK